MLHRTGPGPDRKKPNSSGKHVMAEPQMSSEIRELRSCRQSPMMPALLVGGTMIARVLPASSLSAWDASASFGLPPDEHCLKTVPGIRNNCSVSQQISAFPGQKTHTRYSRSNASTCGMACAYPPPARTTLYGYS